MVIKFILFIIIGMLPQQILKLAYQGQVMLYLLTFL